MRLTFSTQADAQTRADSIHAALCAVDADGKPLYPDYYASAQAGQTVRWAVPYQDYNTDAQGDPTTPIEPNWYVTVSSRCQPVLTAAEQAEAGFPPPSTP